jgi:hypothetical protein
MNRHLSLGVSFCLFCLMLILGGAAKANGAHLETYPSLRPVGSGALKWLGVTLYEATLLAPAGAYRADGLYALEIAYRYGFTRQQLARATLKEIERLQGERGDREALIERFSKLFTDVSAGERITGVHLPGKGADFYGPQGYLGRLQDPQLAADFFQIWLSPSTREPNLRRQLLGALE